MSKEKRKISCILLLNLLFLILYLEKKKANLFRGNKSNSYTGGANSVDQKFTCWYVKHTLVITLNRYLPVFSISSEVVGLYESKGRHRVAQYVGAPHQRDPVVKNNSGREPVEVVRISKP